jgi:uncharacterized membrane protein YqjE
MSSPHLGIFNAGRWLLATLLDIGQVRLALWGTELELERRRMVDGLLWGGVALIVLGVALALLCGFAMALFTQDPHIFAMGIMAFVLLLLGWALMRWARRHLQANDDALAPRVAELQQDRMNSDESAHSLCPPLTKEPAP